VKKRKYPRIYKKAQWSPKLKKTENKMEFKTMEKREFRFNPIAVPLKG
jgi:hypothetical protein